MLKILFCLLITNLIPAGTAQECTADAKKMTYSLDRGHSNVIFRIKHFDVGYVYGMFRLAEGKFQLDPDNLKSSIIEASSKSDSINTNHPKRDDKLKSADYFNINKFKTIDFKSTSIKRIRENNYMVEGNLTLLGVTLSVSAVIKDMGCTWMDHANAFQRGLTGSFTIDRTKFGMKHEDYLSDEVQILISLEGGAQEEK